MQKLRQVRLLYIEDDENLAQSIKKYLVKQGYKVTLAKNGEEGLTLLKNHTFDIVISDYHMPIMDGMMMLRIFAEEGVFPAPFVLVTKHGDERVAVESMKLGASDYLSKDESYSENLLKTVKQIIEKQQLIRERQQTERCLHHRDDNLADVPSGLQESGKRCIGSCSEEAEGEGQNDSQ